MLQPVVMPLDRPPPGMTGRESLARQRAAAHLCLDRSAARGGLLRQMWRRDEAGVPVFENGVCWSLGHKPTGVAGVVASMPMGIDIEEIRPRSEGLWRKITTGPERQRLGAIDWGLFFRVFTAKEAVLKANRVGLARLDGCLLSETPNAGDWLISFEGAPWRVCFWTVFPLIAALAHREEGGAVDWEILAG